MSPTARRASAACPSSTSRAATRRWSGLMVGLFDAQRTGIGRDIDMSLLDTAVSMLSYFAIWTLNRDWVGRATPRLGAPDPRARPELPHPRRLDRRLLQQGQVLARPGGGARGARAGATIRASAPSPTASPTGTRWSRCSRRASATRTTADWLDRLRGRVPCAPVNDVRQALADEQVLARDMIVEVDASRVRDACARCGAPSAPRARSARPRGPRSSASTPTPILRDILGYSASTIARLRAAGVIG